MIFQQRRQLWYAPILAAAVCLTLIRLMLLARILDVHNFALLSGGVLVASTFTMLSCLGLYTVLLRDLPVLIVRRREARGAILLIQAMMVALGCAITAAALTPAWVSLASLAPSTILLGLWYGLSQQWFLVANTDCRSRGELIQFAKENLVRSIAVFITGLSVALWTGSACWVLLAESSVAMALVVASTHRILVRSHVQLKILLGVALRRISALPWRSAAVLLLNSFVGFAVLNADRWLAASQVDQSDFAKYSFLGIVLVCAQAIQGVIGSAVFPALARLKGVEGPHATFKLCATYSLGTLVIACFCAFPLWWAIDWIVGRWYPNYGSSAALLAVLLAVAVFRVSDFWATHLVVIGKENLLLLVNILATLGGSALWWWVMRYAASPGISVLDIGLFALFLSTLGYAGTAAAAWWSHQQLPKSPT